MQTKRTHKTNKSLEKSFSVSLCIVPTAFSLSLFIFRPAMPELPFIPSTVILSLGTILNFPKLDPWDVVQLIGHNLIFSSYIFIVC